VIRIVCDEITFSSDSSAQVLFLVSRNWDIRGGVGDVTKIKLSTLVLAVFLAVGLGLTRSSFAGDIVARSGYGRGLFRAPTRSSGHVRHDQFSPKQQKFFVGEDRLEQPVSVRVQQTIVVSPPEPRNTTKNMIYIQPRWVETEHGVLVSEPGHWVKLESGAEY
jgi:hypothetical protein